MHVTHIWLLLLGVTSVPLVSGCAPLPQRATHPEEIRSVAHQRLRALVDFDPAVASALHADDFQLITPEGSEFTKDSYLGNLKSGRLDYRA
jgi:hypothetical protein